MPLHDETRRYLTTYLHHKNIDSVHSESREIIQLVNFVIYSSPSIPAFPVSYALNRQCKQSLVRKYFCFELSSTIPIAYFLFNRVGYRQSIRERLYRFAFCIKGAFAMQMLTANHTYLDLPGFTTSCLI